MLNRMRNAENRTVQKIIDRAVTIARQSDALAYGTPSSSDTGIFAPSPGLGGATLPDANGNTIQNFMLDMDAMDDLTVRLF